MEIQGSRFWWPCDIIACTIRMHMNSLLATSMNALTSFSSDFNRSAMVFITPNHSLFNPTLKVAVPPSIDTTQQLSQLQAQTHQLQPSEVLIQNGDTGPKRLHVTNIPFRFRDHDLVQMFGVCIYFSYLCYMLMSLVAHNCEQLHPVSVPWSN